MPKFFMILVFLSLTVTVNAQRKTKPTEVELELAKELKATFNDQDVVILNKDINVSFNKNRTSGKVEVSIEEVVDFINISSSSRIQFPVFYDSESRVEDITLRDKNGREISTYLKDEYMSSADLFHTDYRVKYANISLPVKAYKCQVIAKKKYFDIKYFTSQYFVDQYPVVNGSVKIEIPSWLELELKEFNILGFNIKKEVETNKDETVITYAFEDMESRVQEVNSLGPSHIYPHVLFIAKSFKTKDEQKPLFSDVKDLYKWYNGLAKSVVVDTSVFSEKVNELISGASSNKEKIEKIFYWVQDNIRYVAFEDGIAGFKPDSPQNVFTKRYGDCKGMAILTKSMLEMAGFDARLVWIGTDRLAYDYSIPSLSVDNHMICSVVLDGETVFLDGTEKYSRYGEYATRIQNKQALMQDKDNFEILTVPSENVNRNIDKAVYALQLEGESLKGNIKRIFSGETRVAIQNVYNSFGKDDKISLLNKFLAGGNSNYLITEIAPFDEEDRENDLTIEYTASINNAVTEFDGTLYLDIDPIKRFADAEFKDRKTPFNHDFQEKIITEVVVKIPENYKKIELPSDLSISNDIVQVNVKYAQKDHTISYKNEIDFIKRTISKDEFDLWNTTFARLKENLNQQITLTNN